MSDPIVSHSYVQVHNSLIHLVEYNSDKSWAANSLKSALYKGNNKSSESNSSNNSKFDVTRQNLVIFVPGNPGVLGIYHDFLMHLYRVLSSSYGVGSNKRPTILAISHNNFDHPDHVQYPAVGRVVVDESELNFVEREWAKSIGYDPNHIELQVLNKLIIIKRILRERNYSCPFVFVGHSIGCHVILRLLQDSGISRSHGGSILIHPALENLALTNKGSAYVRLFSYKFDLVVQSIAFIVDKLLPKSAKLVLTEWICPDEFVQSSSKIVLESIAQLGCPRTLSALVGMAKSELELVKDIDTDTLIKPHASKLKLIYALNDYWVNTDNRRVLHEKYSDLYIEEQETEHAFVMNPRTVMDYVVKVGMFVREFMEENNSVGVESENVV